MTLFILDITNLSTTLTNADDTAELNPTGGSDASSSVSPSPITCCVHCSTHSSLHCFSHVPDILLVPETQPPASQSAALHKCSTLINNPTAVVKHQGGHATGNSHHNANYLAHNTKTSARRGGPSGPSKCHRHMLPQHPCILLIVLDDADDGNYEDVA